MGCTDGPRVDDVLPTAFRKGDKVKITLDATVTAAGDLVMVDLPGHEEPVCVSKDRVTLVERKRPAPTGNYVLAADGQLYERSKMDRQRWIHRMISYSWEHVERKGEWQELVPRVEREVVAYMDRDDDVWTVEDGTDEVARVGVSGIDRRDLKDIERLYGPLRPLVVDPNYKETEE